MFYELSVIELFYRNAITAVVTVLPSKQIESKHDTDLPIKVFLYSTRFSNFSLLIFFLKMIAFLFDILHLETS